MGHRAPASVTSRDQLRRIAFGSTCYVTFAGAQQQARGSEHAAVVAVHDAEAALVAAHDASMVAARCVHLSVVGALWPDSAFGPRS